MFSNFDENVSSSYRTIIWIALAIIEIRIYKKHPWIEY